eukprot:UN04009
MLESKDRTVIVVDQKSEFTGMHVINGKEKYGSPLRIYTSPLFIIGYSDKLNKWDTLRAIFHVHRWIGMSIWGLNLMYR